MRFDRVYIDGSGTILNPDVRDEIRDTLKAMKGEYLDITIEIHKDRRSQKANAYLWGHVYALMAEHTGYDANTIHDAMCEKFLPYARKQVEFYNDLTGASETVSTDPRHSSKLTGTAFYDFVECVRQFAREFLNVETQDPDPAYWRKRHARAA